MIRWPEEDSHSVVPITRILSPPQEIAIGAMCKVKGFEKFISEIMALGTKEEMNKLDAMDSSGESSGVSGKENVIDQPTTKRKVAKNNKAAEGNPPTKKLKVTGKGRQKKVERPL